MAVLRRGQCHWSIWYLSYFPTFECWQA